MKQFTPEAFGKRVLQARLNAGAARGKELTQTEVADKVGVTQVTVGRWEAGSNVPDPATIQKLASVLGMAAADLLFGPATGSGEPVEDPAKKRQKKPSRSA